MTITAPAATKTLQPVNTGSLLTSKPENPVRRGPIVLALHGSEPTSAPVVFARQLSKRLGVGLEVLSVVEPTYMYGTGLGLSMVTAPLLYDDFGEIQEEIVKKTLRDMCDDVPWNLTIRHGSPGQEIARRAGEVDATMIVVGAAPHRVLGHDVSGVRALQVVRRTTCPVVSVAPDITGLPGTVVAAIDFSPASIRAAEAALLALGDGGRVILAHVPIPVPLRRPSADHTGALYGVDIGDVFERLREELRPFLPPNGTLETRQLEGRVAKELVELAHEVNADLITVGRHSRNVVERLFVGSVAMTVMHGATCSVLASPDTSTAETVRLKLRITDTATTENPGDWAEVLAAVNKRNAGRKVILEENDPAIGAQIQASGFVLMGIDYDERGKRVDVMLGHAGGATAHLTRSVGGVDMIAIKAGPGERDQAIDIQHGDSHTLVMFDE